MPELHNTQAFASLGTRLFGILLTKAIVEALPLSSFHQHFRTELLALAGVVLSNSTQS